MSKKMTVSEIQKLLGYEIEIVAEKKCKSIAEIPVGEVFKISDVEFIVLEHDKENNSTAAITKDFITKTVFDNSTNNFEFSSVGNKVLGDFIMKLQREVGLCFMPHKVDLTSDDGRKDYGEIDCYASLLTCNRYRKYVDILDKYRPDSWWWLATAYSTKSNGYTRFVRCARSLGTLGYDNCDNRGGVRPFCVFKSDISVFYIG